MTSLRLKPWLSSNGLAEAALQAFEAQSTLWNSCRPVAFSRAGHGIAEGRAEPGDISNIQDPASSIQRGQKTLFRLPKADLLITSRGQDTLVSAAEDLDPHTRNKARFYITRS